MGRSRRGDAKMTLKDLLIQDEALKFKPYVDCCGKTWRECACVNKGKLTVLVGRNLDDVGFTIQEAMFCLDNDIAKATRQVDAAFPWFKTLSETRQMVIISMVFNLGISKFLDFRGMIAALQRGDFARAADEMLDSAWSRQVKARAVRLAQMMREDKLP